MKQRPHRGKSRVDPDGVRTTRHERSSLLHSIPLLATAATVSLAALLVIRTLDRPAHVGRPDPRGEAHVHQSLNAPPSPARPPAPTQARQPAPQEKAARKSTRAVVRRRLEAKNADSRLPEPRTEDTRREGDSEFHARDYIAALRAGGETGGLAAFPPPGTRPPRTGVIVPEDYVLPEGFARHYQATDDGVRLDPILTVAPGYELVDEAGRPIPLADNRIVPPDLAPPDLPVRMLEIPSEQDREQRDH